MSDMQLVEALAIIRKAGARHSKADQDAIQVAHDALVEAGAMCDRSGADKSHRHDDLRKIGGLNDAPDLMKSLGELQGTLDQISKMNAELSASIKRIEDQPAPHPIFRATFSSPNSPTSGLQNYGQSAAATSGPTYPDSMPDRLVPMRRRDGKKPAASVELPNGSYATPDANGMIMAPAGMQTRMSLEGWVRVD